jgi:hypothetical protein
MNYMTTAVSHQSYGLLVKYVEVVLTMTKTKFKTQMPLKAIEGFRGCP